MNWLNRNLFRDGSSFSKRAPLFLVIIFGLISSSCFLPDPPGKTVFQKQKIIQNESGDFILSTPTTRDLTSYRSGRDSWSQRQNRPQKNLLFVAVDDTVQGQFQEPLQRAYNTDNDVRIEDIAWWRFAPEFRGLYDKVLKIRHGSLNARSLKWALEHLESLGKKFDVMLLTHGLPNNITASQGEGFISYKDLKDMGPLKHLNMVFMQGCFSETLASDWIKNGAKTVLSYEGWNRNFFYVDFFLPAYRKEKDAVAAYHHVNKSIKEKMQRSFIYGRVLDELGLSLEEYFQVSPHPILDHKD